MSVLWEDTKGLINNYLHWQQNVVNNYEFGKIAFKSPRLVLR